MILQKLQQARDIIKGSTLKKAGWNEYSKYHYFTPEQINQLVHDAEKQTGLIHTFNMERNEFGIYGRLEIYDIEEDDSLVFIQATAIPQITATNATQQIGGSVTFTLRYMLMTAFDIVDNTLDFDSQDNREKKQEPEKKVTPTANPKNAPERSRFPISDNAFNQLCDKLKANPDPLDRGNLLAKTRKYYPPLSEAQEKIISEITDNL